MNIIQLFEALHWLQILGIIAGAIVLVYVCYLAFITGDHYSKRPK